MGKKRIKRKTKEETFSESVEKYLISDKKAKDMFELMIQFYIATRPDSGLHYDVVMKILEKKIDKN